MAEVVLENLLKTYPEKGGAGVRAVNGINLTVKDREFMVLVGPSGCGKSTTLRMIAGLEEISGGTIAIDGKVVNEVPPKDRDIAMVFQNYALYPHMSVYDNMAFGLKMRKFPQAEIDGRVQEAAALLGLEAYLGRKPKALSGGQRQRVAVGRAIVRRPKVFLFDEPLSNLDAQMRVSMRMELSKLHARLNATMIYVTHDQVEAMTMGDRICVMKGGDIMQVDEPLELYHRPHNAFVGGFVGSPPMNFFRGSIVRRSESWAFVEAGGPPEGLILPLPEAVAARLAIRANQPLILGFRPEDVHEAFGGNLTHTLAAAEVRVDAFEPMGAEAFLYLDSGRTRFVARVAPSGHFRAEQRVRVAFDFTSARLFDAGTEQALTW
jgi:multiple sugar transport system ATP-binding protein